MLIDGANVIFICLILIIIKTIAMTSSTNVEIKLQPMKCELNYLDKSDGSAILAQGETVVVVSVNGPLETKMLNQTIEKANLEVIFFSNGGKPCVNDRYKEHLIRQTFEAAILSSLHPRSAIAVTIQEMEDCGGLLSCCINTACLALINSGLAMRTVFAAVMCCINESGNIILDPKKADLQNAQATMTFVFDGRDTSLITCATEGIFTENAYYEALQHCKEASHVVFAFYKEIIVKYAKTI